MEHFLIETRQKKTKGFFKFERNRQCPLNLKWVGVLRSFDGSNEAPLVADGVTAPGLLP